MPKSSWQYIVWIRGTSERVHGAIMEELALFARAFLAESLEELGLNLESIGCKLLIASGKPEDLLPQVLSGGDVLAYQSEDTSEEQDVETLVRARLPKLVTVLTHHGHTLCHRDDLGFDVKETLPIPFGKFKFGIVDNQEVRKEYPAPVRGKLPAPSVISDDTLSTLQSIPSKASSIEAVMGCGSPSVLEDSDQSAAIVWRGGETAALARLVEYVENGLGTYHRTRNQIQGANSSSHLSPWMANGCLSPRTVYWAVNRFEFPQDKKAGFDHIYKFVFELHWRDYFRLYCAHFGKSVFFLGGPAKRKHDWRRDPDVEAKWKSGCTGVPLVDALMRELMATGYIANRGRYIVACYLVHYLGIDWRVGADWFERHLLDHDVCSNYGEWASMANVAAAPTRGQPLGLKGKGPTKSPSTGSRGSAGDPWKQGAEIGFAMFDPWEQGLQYDKKESYVKRWLPELRLVPDGYAHRPHALSAQERRKANCESYPIPLALEPFQYTSDPTRSDRKQRRMNSAPETKQDSYYDRPSQKTSRWSNSSSMADTSSRRRWQPKGSSTRVVYMET